MSRSARGRRRFVRVLATLATAGAMLPLAAASAGAATAGPSSPGRAQAGAGSVAPGAPGSMSYFDLARKDCVGTATGTASKVWYTVAGGVLSDTYEPTIDNTNVSTLQYVVTDGSTFTDLQTRDMSYTVSADPDRHGLHGDGDRCPARLPADHHVHHRPRPRHRAHAHAAERRTRLRDQGGRAAPVRAAGRPRERERRRRYPERRGQQRRRHDLGRIRDPGRLQHEHGHRRHQPDLRGADLHGAGRQHSRAGGECRLRRHRQRRTHPAGLVARADPVLVRAGRPHRGDPGAGARPGRHADARARLRPHAGAAR